MNSVCFFLNGFVRSCLMFLILAWFGFMFFFERMSEFVKIGMSDEMNRTCTLYCIDSACTCRQYMCVTGLDMHSTLHDSIQAGGIVYVRM